PMPNSRPRTGVSVLRASNCSRRPPASCRSPSSRHCMPNRKIARPAHSCSQPASRQNDQARTATTTASSNTRSFEANAPLPLQRAPLDRAIARPPTRRAAHARPRPRALDAARSARVATHSREAATMVRWLKRLVVVGLLAMVAAGGLAWWTLRGSLPALDGELALTGLSAPVSVQRDALGVVTIDAQDEADAMRVLGYVHAQERYFEMDLLRRTSAGELSALFGAGALDVDCRHRVHRMRAR